VEGAPASAKVLVGDADLTVEGTRVALAKLDEYAVVLVE
jgi:hypothetical protein